MKAPLVRFAYASALALVGTYAYMTLHGPQGVHALSQKRAQIRELEQRNAGLAQQIERKREHIRRLAENPAEQELEIRERLKLVHPNEKIYILGESARN